MEQDKTGMRIADRRHICTGEIVRRHRVDASIMRRYNSASRKANEMFST